MLIASLLTSLQTVLGTTQVEAQPLAVPEKASILDTSPHSFQNEVPLGDVESYTLSVTDEISDVVVGTATLVETEAEQTNLYLEMNMPYVQAALHFGTCEEPQEVAATFAPTSDKKEPLVVSESLEELLHPRLDYILQVETATSTYCAEL